MSVAPANMHKPDCRKEVFNMKKVPNVMRFSMNLHWRLERLAMTKRQ